MNGLSISHSLTSEDLEDPVFRWSEGVVGWAGFTTAGGGVCRGGQAVGGLGRGGSICE